MKIESGCLDKGSKAHVKRFQSFKNKILCEFKINGAWKIRIFLLR